MSDYKEIQEQNKTIAELVRDMPEIEYYVGTEEGMRFNPKNLGFDTLYSQKRECERFLQEHHSKGWSLECTVREAQWWPRYESDFNVLIPAFAKAKKILGKSFTLARAEAYILNADIENAHFVLYHAIKSYNETTSNRT